MIDLAMGFVIIVNALTLGIRVDRDKEWLGWITVDIGFALVFTLDIIGKFWFRDCKSIVCAYDVLWTIYEVAMATFAYVEIFLTLANLDPEESGGVFAALRVLRLVRIARILSIVRIPIFTELVMMIDGIVGGFKTLIWSQLLLAVPIYVVALLFRETLGRHSSSARGAEYFGTLSISFFTTFRCFVVGDCSTDDGRPIMVEVADAYGSGFAIFYSAISVLMTFGLYNVIIAIYVENTVAAAKFNELRLKQNRLMDEQMFAQKALELCIFVWQSHPDNLANSPFTSLEMHEISDITIKPDFFEDLRKNQLFRDILRELDIADEDQFELFDTVDVDGSGSIGLEDLVQGIAKLRGGARRSDIVGVSLMMRALQAEVSAFQRAISRQLEGSYKVTLTKSKESQPPRGRT